MSDIKPIKIEKTVTTIEGWACDRCELTFPYEKEARSHRAGHCYTHYHWLNGDGLYRFNNESDFTYWKQYGPYREAGGCAGPWHGIGWYILAWRGGSDEYPSLDLASAEIKLRYENAKYTFDQASENITEFIKLTALDP
jgi:hypothetical protein